MPLRITHTGGDLEGDSRARGSEIVEDVRGGVRPGVVSRRQTLLFQVNDDPRTEWHAECHAALRQVFHHGCANLRPVWRSRVKET